jgi:hypothetical protein
MKLTRKCMPHNHMTELSYGVGICFVLLIKQKYARIIRVQMSHALWCDETV